MCIVKWVVTDYLGLFLCLDYDGNALFTNKLEKAVTFEVYDEAVEHAACCDGSVRQVQLCLQSQQ